MLICEIMLLLLALIICSFSSYTDIKMSRIHNKVLLVSVCAGIIIDAIYYFVFAQNYFLDFLVNAIMLLIIALLLYCLHIWAGGDAKLLMVISLLVPARWYIGINGKFYTTVAIVAVAFVIGYCYLVVDSIKVAFQKRQTVSKKDFISALFLFTKNYIGLSAYLLCFRVLNVCIISKYLHISASIYIIDCIAVVLIASRFPLLKKWFVVVPLYCIGIVSLFIFKLGFNLSNLYGYLILLFFEIIRILVTKYNYDEINTNEIKPGMILSASSSVLINMTHLKDIPGISKEDQRSRLTEAEAMAVVNWGKSRFGSETITIVRKIPFAIFISLGTIIYLILGGVMLL